MLECFKLFLNNVKGTQKHRLQHKKIDDGSAKNYTQEMMQIHSMLQEQNSVEESQALSIVQIQQLGDSKNTQTKLKRDQLQTPISAKTKVTQKQPGKAS